MPIESEARTLPMSREDAAALAEAVCLLERTSLAARLTNMLGRQIELAGTIVPERVRNVVSHAAMSALETALVAALRSLEHGPRHYRRPASPRLHKVLAAASGAVGGAFGLALLPLELPISTTLMLRSIADVGREEGEDLARPEAALACMQVFALGGRTRGDDYVEGGYFAVRGLLANSISEATRYLLERGTAEEGAPVLVRLIGQIAARFGIVVGEKVAAQAVPVLGALGAAGVNYAFIDHFQALARGHFIVRRLERSYGAEVVRGEYENWRDAEAAVAAGA
jgi:hypothetical protein